MGVGEPVLHIGTGQGLLQVDAVNPCQEIFAVRSCSGTVEIGLMLIQHLVQRKKCFLLCPELMVRMQKMSCIQHQAFLLIMDTFQQKISKQVGR